MEFGVQKLAMAAAIAAVAWLGGALPVWAGRDSAESPLLSWGNALAAGILLGIGLIHMLAESATAFGEQGFHYPIAYLLAASAFLALLLLEHVVLPEAAHQAVHARSGEAHHALDAGDHAHEFAPYALIGALSVHSVFAGVTLGAQEEFGHGLALFSGLLAHKAVEGLALGVSLARSGLPSSRGLGILGLFALLTPAGIALGASVAGILDAPGSRLFESASLALAGGTFLYIASLDLTRDEYLKPGKAWQKWACTALGVALTALLAG